MRIKTATAAEMLLLWGEDPAHPTPTARFNCENLENGNATLFVWDRDGELDSMEDFSWTICYC